jgi:hypothetical protein
MNILINNTSYQVDIKIKHKLYYKIKIIENGIDVTESSFQDKLFLDSLFKAINKDDNNINIANDHHFIPQHALKKWANKDGLFHAIRLNKNNNIKTIEILDDNNQKAFKNLKEKFSSLHNYTFLIDRQIIIFEGHFITYIENFIFKLIDFISDNKLKIDGNMEDITINIEGEQEPINITQMLLEGANIDIYSDKILLNENDAIKAYLYSLILLSYAMIDRNKNQINKTFSTIYNVFETKLNDLSIKEALTLYFQKLCMETQKHLSEKHFNSNNVRFSHLKAPQNYDFMITESWFFATKNNFDENEVILIPINPKSAIIFSKNPNVLSAFENKINSNANYILSLLDREFALLDDLREKEHYKKKSIDRLTSSTTYILFTEKNRKIIEDHLFGTLNKNNYIDEPYIKEFPHVSGMVRKDFFESQYINLNLLFKYKFIKKYIFNMKEYKS